MYILLGIIIAFLSGIMDSAFVIPTKYIQKIPQSVMWFIFGFVGFIICGILFFLYLDGMQMYSFLLFKHIPLKYIIVLTICCFFWGIGMICLCYAIKYVGIGISMSINIGIGTAGSALLPFICVHPKKLFTISGLLIMLAVMLFVIGVILYGIAANRRDKQQCTDNVSHNSMAILGVVLSIVCGIGSALQAVSYTYCIDGIVGFFPFKQSDFWISCAPLAISYIATGVPYCLYHLIQSLKISNSLIQDVKTVFTDYIVFKEVMLSALMGLILFGATVMFCISLAMMPNINYGVLVILPLFIISIALGSNIWGFVYNEWQGCDGSIISKVLYGLILFVMAIVIIGISSYIDIL